MSNKIKEDLEGKKRFGGLLGNVHPAVIAIWAALIAVGNILPAIPIIGSGGTFSASAALTPLAGIFFGPIAGAICAAIGKFLGQLLAPHTAWLGIGTFLVGTVNAFVTGMVSRKRWYWAIGIIGVGWVLWYTTEIGRGAPIFPLVFYSLGIIAALAGGLYGAKKLTSDNNLLRGVGIFLAVYAGFVGAAAVANYFGILLLQIPTNVWKGLVFVSPWERAIFSLGSAIIGVPLLIGLPKIGVFVGPEFDNEEDLEE